ncbi:MAG: LuxR C-terminal-related transcriptional regulator [Desulfobacteraceae bacterium]
MMDRSHSLIMENVLQVICTAGESLDRYRVRRQALDAIFHTIPAEGAIFFMPDGKGRFSDVMLKNLEPEYNHYYHRYYHVFDPLRLTEGECAGNRVRRLEEVVSYDSFESTEYYNDFLKPQEIHHKLVVNLKAGGELHGKIVLTRPKKGARFSQKEARFAQKLSPYLSNALALSDLRRMVRLKGSLLKCIEEESSIGMILLDDTLHEVYRNQKAVEILKDVGQSNSGPDASDRIFSRILEDCREIKSRLQKAPAEGKAVTPQRRIVKGARSRRFSLRLKTFEQEPGCEGSRLFMICLEHLPEATPFDRRRLADGFHLSKREVDVVSHLFSGQSNAEIASRLYISEITVKKHLQNIYAKVGVKSRTSLINKVLSL